MRNDTQMIYDRALIYYALHNYDKAIKELERIVVIVDSGCCSRIIDNPLEKSKINQEEVIYTLIKCCKKSKKYDLMHKYCNMVLQNSERFSPGFCFKVSEII